MRTEGLADHKRQHYVPRCHFRPFSPNDEGRMISMFNIAREKLIDKTSISGQCFRNYFYGDDLIIEKSFQQLEGWYADFIRDIKRGKSQFQPKEANSIRVFMALQFSRTESAITRMAQAFDGMTHQIFDGKPEEYRRHMPEPRSDFSLMMSSLRIGIQIATIWNDLKFCIVTNCTRNEFITSDDPVVMTNKFYFQKIRESNFGFSSAGAMIFMPLTPKHTALFYDGNVYNLSGKIDHVIHIHRKQDVLFFNECQYMKAKDNLYFSTTADAESILTEFQAVKSCRPSKWFNTMTLIPVHSEVKGIRKYRRANEEERICSRESLVNTSLIYPKPRSWPSILSFKKKPIAYSNGSAVGWIRKKEWFNGGLDREIDHEMRHFET
jgi:hypothetical protein